MSEFDVSAVDLSGILNEQRERKLSSCPILLGFMLLTVVPEAMEEYAESEVWYC